MRPAWRILSRASGHSLAKLPHLVERAHVVVPESAAGYAPKVEYGRLASRGAEHVAVDQQVLIEAIERVVQRCPVGADLDSRYICDFAEVSPLKLNTSLKSTGRSFLLRSLVHG